MFKPDKHKQETKQFTVSNDELSELSFLATVLRIKQEELAFFSERLRQVRAGVERRYSLNETFEVDWSHVFPEGKIFAKKRPLQEAPKDGNELQQESK